MAALILNELDYLDSVLYYPVLVVVLVVAGLYFSWRTRLVQLRMCAESIRVVLEKPQGAESVSSFQALMVSTASRVGTGNIIGISTAICLGGPGSVFWMWLVAIIGGASAFIESTLAQIYKRRDSQGGSYGGPAYYIETALHSRFIGAVFALFLILTYAGGFNLLASYNLQSTFAVYSFYDKATTPWILGAIFAVLVGYCILGGGKRIVRTTSWIVPIMGGIYVVAALYIILTHITMCLCSGVPITKEAAGATYVQQALTADLGSFGPILITVCMVLFAFSTLIGNLFYVDNCLTFLHGKVPSKSFMVAYRIIAALIIFVGAGMSMAAAWDIADIFMAFMCLINIPACAILGTTAVKAMKDYERQKKEGKNPVFLAKNIGLDETNLDFWK